MLVRLKSLADGRILAGALTGRKALGLLLERIDHDAEKPEPIYLDFSGIEIATASFLRECILEFRDIVRKRWINYYPVIANANDTTVEELSILIHSQRDALMLCTLSRNGVPSSPRLVGDLDPKQRVAFDLVQKLGEADAGQLMRSSNSSEDVGQTAWNNRLASLSRLGLLMEFSHGRTKSYKPLPLEE
jgi:hypothetical protein